MLEVKWISYLRVSTDRQGKSGLGIEAQRNSVAEYLDGGNWSLVKEYAEVETQVCMNQLWMQRFHQNLPQVVAGTMKAGRRIISFLTAAKPTTMQHRGMDVSPGEIIVNNSDVLHQRTGAGFRMGGMSLPTGALMSHAGR